MPLGMLGKYERLDVLGHGVSGIVYLARDTLLNKQVALKEVDVQAGDLRRFLEEARVMDRLRHPNIVRVNGVDRIEGKIVIDMEYVRGANLQEILRAEGPLPLDRALDIAIQVLDALDYAHTMQTVHRDIKPANILIARDGMVKLVDFGLAEILATNAYAGGAGTYAYMAPEDFAAEDRSDRQSDLWAVGITLYEMLTCERPFAVTQVRDPFAWKRALDGQPPTPLAEFLPEAPPALQAILDRALARDKEDRYATAGAFRDDLRALRDGQMPAAVREAVVETRASRTRPLFTPATPGAREPLPPTEPGTVAEGELTEHNRRERPYEEPEPPRGPFEGQGRVVADVNADLAAQSPDRPRRPRLPFMGRKTEARLTVEPERVDFGEVRKGELRSVRLQVRVVGGDGNVAGRVIHQPGWLTVHPLVFDRTRQAITLTAHTARAWETGEFHETVTVETSAGTTDVPVRLVVLKPRPTFLQVAFWYAPLFAVTLLPILAVALGSAGGTLSQTAAGLMPAAAAATGLLATMLLLVSIAADIGIAERAACGMVMVAMCFLLGMSAAARHTSSVVLVLQLMHLRRWMLWALVTACLGLLIGGAFLRVVLLQH